MSSKSSESGLKSILILFGMKNSKLISGVFKAGTYIILAAFLLLCLTLCVRQSGPAADSRTTSFDDGWHFIKDSIAGAEAPGYDDSDWRTLDVPHDWSIEDLPGQNNDDVRGPFAESAIDKMSSGYTVGGTGWYRKSFTVDEKNADKIAYIQFDGVYMNADIWLNGNHLGFHPYGYTPFYYDLSPYLNPAGQPNLVAVRVRNEGLNSRWYSGSGINRHVWLTFVRPVHIDLLGGVYVTTPAITENSANVKVVTTLVNSGSQEKNVVLQAELTDPSGKIVASNSTNSKITAGQTKELIQEIPVSDPSLWSIDNPGLYNAKVSVLINGEVTDGTETSFGIRTIKFDAENGMTINGVSVDMIGGCYHHDNGPLGAASVDRAEERKIELLKANGFNAIRTSHNPPSPALLDACDRLGMVVIDEIFDMWERPKKARDYHLYFREWWKKDVDSWILRDRNHPSVVLWSIGNEIPEAGDTSGYRIATNLAHEVRLMDPSRAVTEGMVGRFDNYVDHMKLLDVVGYNYAYRRYESDHDNFPDRIIVATETQPPQALANYEMVEKLPYVVGYFVWTAIDNIGEAAVGLPRLTDTAAMNMRRSAFGAAAGARSGQQGQRQQGQRQGNAGAARGTSAGNRSGAPQGARGANAGGPPPGGGGGGFFSANSWPVYTNYQGDLDLIGNRKAPSYYQFVVWGKSKVEILVHRPVPAGMREMTSPWGFPDELKSWNWNGHEGEKFQVHVYTRSQHVKLELNGKLVGEQDVDQGNSITATFEVPYEPGTLVAHCYDEGKETASQTLITTGKPASVRLVADRTKINADRNDLSYIRAEITDSDGNIVPDADNVIVTFIVTGDGEVAGVGSGDPRDMSSFQQPRKKTYEGICLAVIRPEKTRGKINVRATAPGLKEATLVISVR